MGWYGRMLPGPWCKPVYLSLPEFLKLFMEAIRLSISPETGHISHYAGLAVAVS